MIVSYDAFPGYLYILQQHLSVNVKMKKLRILPASQIFLLRIFSRLSIWMNCLLYPAADRELIDSVYNQRQYADDRAFSLLQLIYVRCFE